MKDIERTIVDFFEVSGADVEEIDGEWFVYIDDGALIEARASIPVTSTYAP